MATRRPRALRPLGLTATLLGVVPAIHAMTMTNGVEFLFPTQGVTLHYNDYVQVQYVSNFTDPWLFTFCRSSDGTISQKLKGEVGGTNNTATVKLDWPGSDTPCWFDLKPNSSAATGSGANSDSWSFDVSQRAATTVGLGSPSSAAPAPNTPTSGGGSATPAASASSSSSSSLSSLSSGGGLSAGAQAGIGVGAAVAGIALGAAAAVLYMRRRRKRRRQRMGAAIEADRGHGNDGSYVGSQESKARAPNRTPVSEVEGHYPTPQELPSTQPGPYEMDSTQHR